MSNRILNKASAVFVGLSAAFFSTILPASDALAEQEPQQVRGDFRLDGSTGISESGEFGLSSVPGLASDYSLPLDIAISPWEFPFSFGGQHGLWVNANDQGRVRANAITGTRSPPFTSQFGNARLTWEGNYIRGTGPAPTATLYRSWLDVFADAAGPGILRDRSGKNVSPFAAMGIEVSICGFIAGDGGYHCEPILQHNSRVMGIQDDPLDPLDLEWNRNRTVGTANSELEFDLIKAVPYNNGGGLRFELPEEELDLAFDIFRIAPGEPYSVRYELSATAAQDFNEHFAAAVIGDPLDPEVGGLSINNSDILTDSSEHFCEYAGDPARYDVHDDGTVTDSSTGLMWQRCPVGYELDDRGTPDTADDLCVPDLSFDLEYDWASALAVAVTDSAAGYEDWLLPNVKQLESITELSCRQPTVDTDAFPDTPALPFWSSTPQSGAEGAWIVGFGVGEVRPDPRGDANHVRLVRQSGVTPSPETPGILVGNVAAVEGDFIQRPMVFTVALTGVASTDVSVDYATSSLVADDATDFVPTSGTVTIPAGALSAEIEVQINGDVEVEGDEPFWMLLSNLNGDAYLRDRVAYGTIIDDEPVASVRAVTDAINEGDFGTQDVEFEISLDKPAAGPITVDYATADVTATAGSDYTAVSGTLVFGLGDRDQSVFVSISGDVVEEGDERLDLVLSNPTGATLDPDPDNSMAELVIMDDDAPGTFAALNDTGVTYCADAANSLLACPQTGFPEQDGETGRDLTANDPSDGFAGFSFTKLDEFGVPLVDQQATYPYVNVPPNPTQARWDCVVDEVTGLVWEVKTDVPDDLRHYDWTYSWFNPSGNNDGGDAGFPDGGNCAARNDCDTAGYVAAVNAAGLCGFSDWRVPSLDELGTITIFVLDSNVARGLDDSYFPHNYITTSSDRGFTYWSSTSYAGDSAQAWSQTFESGGATQNRVDKTTLVPMRLVRGGQ